MHGGHLHGATNVGETHGQEYKSVVRLCGPGEVFRWSTKGGDEVGHEEVRCEGVVGTSSDGMMQWGEHHGEDGCWRQWEL